MSMVLPLPLLGPASGASRGHARSSKTSRIEEASAPEKRRKAQRGRAEALPLGAGARMNARVVLAVLLVALALWTAAGFLPALIWATILAVALWPLYIKFAKRFASGPSGLAAFIFTLIVALILVTPMALAVYQIAQQGDVLVGWLKKAGESGVDVPEWIARLPIAAESVQQWWRDNLSDPKAATDLLKAINAENASDLFRPSALSCSTACSCCSFRCWPCSCCCATAARSRPASWRPPTASLARPARG